MGRPTNPSIRVQCILTAGVRPPPDEKLIKWGLDLGRFGPGPSTGNCRRNCRLDRGGMGADHPGKDLFYIGERICPTGFRYHKVENVPATCSDTCNWINNLEKVPCQFQHKLIYIVFNKGTAFTDPKFAAELCQNSRSETLDKLPRLKQGQESIPLKNHCHHPIDRISVFPFWNIAQRIINIKRLQLVYWYLYYRIKSAVHTHLTVFLQFSGRLPAITKQYSGTSHI